MRTGLSYHEAVSIALSAARRLDSETLPLSAALGRICARDLDAPFALPGFANSAMDGYAVRGDDLAGEGERRFELVTRILAGDTAHHALGPGQAAAIMTGALMPQHGDTVVIRESARVDGDAVWLPAGAVRGANVRSADDDCAVGDRVLARGEVLTVPRLAMLASFGIEQVEVSRRPRVAVLVTGDELVPPDRPLVPGQRHDSNGTLLSAAAKAAGAEPIACERCGDDPDVLSQTLRRLSIGADVLLTSGGVSAGEADHLPDAIGCLGEILFWKVRMKPGMPVLCGRIDDCMVFALPGNSVSAGVTFQVLARPVLHAMQGRRMPHGPTAKARLAVRWRKTHARLEFLRVRLQCNERGELIATPFERQGSGVLSVLADADALALLPEGARDYAAGDIVEVQGSMPIPFD